MSCLSPVTSKRFQSHVFHLWSQHAIFEAILSSHRFTTARLLTSWAGYFFHDGRLWSASRTRSILLVPVRCMPVLLSPPYALLTVPTHKTLFLYTRPYSLGWLQFREKRKFAPGWQFLESKKIDVHNTNTFKISQWGMSFERC